MVVSICFTPAMEAFRASKSCLIIDTMSLVPHDHCQREPVSAPPALFSVSACLDSCLQCMGDEMQEPQIPMGQSGCE